MHRSWNKGFTKETHPSVLKISETMMRRKIDNFAQWREQMRERGLIKSCYQEFEKDGDLAELIGVLLGDGHIQAFPRTERLYLSSNSDNRGFIERYAGIIEKIFQKRPTLMKAKDSRCVRIALYEKFISERLGIPTGSRKNITTVVPKWIWCRQEYLIRYLRGLYEAEGSFCVHKPTCTYKLFFSNRNESLLDIVYDGVSRLGFHPHRSRYQIQVSRREEVFRLKELLQFRNYS